MPIAMSREEFEDAVGDALDTIPQELLDRLDNVAITVEDEPAPGSAPGLLGLYVGVPLTARDSGYGLGNLPDHIYIFRGPLTRYCRSREELLQQIRVTVLHEIGHHFGISDERLHELGWG
ncbi:metallopeptidase family protein [Flexivirga oryzae]|uniref:Putative Zn-dependent protease with MMP-like domain n=1 Tax=Flexivirga oryzae TaxID=1794944 RepID=A0A839N6C4_9MICO|nr:metallopeptidase family protein [Flexivirga oryzae]MBB2892319.1 putative Zn-dependent protease with MMP-like domain [Flexivirga oryzae]